MSKVALMRALFPSLILTKRAHSRAAQCAQFVRDAIAIDFFPRPTGGGVNVQLVAIVVHSAIVVWPHQPNCRVAQLGGEWSRANLPLPANVPYVYLPSRRRARGLRYSACSSLRTTSASRISRPIRHRAHSAIRTRGLSSDERTLCDAVLCSVHGIARKAAAVPENSTLEEHLARTNKSCSFFCNSCIKTTI